MSGPTFSLCLNVAWPQEVTFDESNKTSIIVPDIGVRVLRKRGEDRAIVPPRFVKLRDMHKVKHGEGCGPVMSCIVCEMPYTDVKAVIQCATCLLPWHSACAALVLDRTAEQIASLPSRSTDCIPDGFGDAVCDLCDAFVRSRAG
jgi:hypothetical protein